jgi:hypothetical protein
MAVNEVISRPIVSKLRRRDNNNNNNNNNNNTEHTPADQPA